MKLISPLHRAQSVKVSSSSSSNNKVFRPDDLAYGEVVGSGCFGDVIKVDNIYSTFICTNMFHIWGKFTHYED